MELDETYARVSAEKEDEEDDVIFLGSRTNYGEDLDSSDVSSSAEHSSACEHEGAPTPVLLIHPSIFGGLLIIEFGRFAWHQTMHANGADEAEDGEYSQRGRQQGQVSTRQW